jgi:hypothetical protein
MVQWNSTERVRNRRVAMAAGVWQWPVPAAFPPTPSDGLQPAGHRRTAGTCPRRWEAESAHTALVCAAAATCLRAPGLLHVCAGTRPHLRRDWPASAPGLDRICAGTASHLRRDCFTSAPGLLHICAGTRPHLRRDCFTSAVASARRRQRWRPSVAAVAASLAVYGGASLGLLSD